LFLEYGADFRISDSRGWLPIEHAAYRGHFPVLKLLVSLDGFDASADLQAGSLHTTPLVLTNKTKESHIPWIHGSPETFKGSYVWIRLGNNDATNPIKALQIEETRSSTRPSSYADEVLYTISLSVPGKPYVVKEWTLPMLESSVNKPWLFETETIDDLKLVWQLYTHSNADVKTKKLVGSGIALMDILNRGSRQNRESVVRDTTVPLLEPNTATYVGSITFTYFWSKPHPPPQRLRKPHYWEFGNGIGGHRGSGKNAINNKKLQIGENTAQSFSTAISHGASFLEFDVQLTKDLVPVVYHDFLISETGTDSTMHTLTYDQFKTISSVQGPRRGRDSRSNSLQSADYGYLETFQERMDQTHFNKVNGFKANTRGTFIHERTCSLEEVLRHVPVSVPLNIELKYPMLFETEEWDMELLAIKTDIFVDTILDKVYEHVEGRTIVFSSFNPEICIALSTKQRSFPVFFLSKTAAPRGEVRSSCIQQAVHFAKSWGLPGIVAECTPFVNCPRIIEYVQSAGLTVTSFGVGNSDKENVKVGSHSCLAQ
jgi:glycerophosphodiester phosphodiesterase